MFRQVKTVQLKNQHMIPSWAKLSYTPTSWLAILAFTAAEK